MGHMYNIEIETKYTLLQCQKILLKGIHYEVLDTSTEFRVHTPYFVMVFEELGSDDHASSRVLGMNPTISILIHHFPRKDSIQTLYRVFMKWVKATDDTAILLYEGESVRFQSKQGRLIRNSDPRTWRGDLDELIDKKYTDEDFPIL